MNKQKDGMRYPSIDELTKIINSKYKLAYTSAKVAKLIQNKKVHVENSLCDKEVGKALEEILAGNVQIEF